MSPCPRPPLLGAVCLALLCSAALGYIDTYHYDITTAYADVLEVDFGMVRDAEIKIETIISDPGNSTYFLFIIVDRNSFLGWYEYLSDGALSAESAEEYCSRPSTFRLHAAVRSAEYTVAVPETDRYSVLLVQCYDVGLSEPVAVDVKLTMSNPAPRGDGVFYSTIELLPMLPILQMEIGLLVVGIVGLITAIAARPHLCKAMHGMFLAVLLLALLVAVLESDGGARVADTGDRKHSLDAEVSLMQVFQVTAFYTCSLLLSFGYSVYRPRLPPSEAKYIFGIMALFFAFSVSKASCNWNESDFCRTVDIYLFLLRGIVIISTLLGGNYTVSRLRNNIHSSPWSPTLPMQYYWLDKYTMWRNLYILYIILPTGFAIIETTMLSWKSRWIVVTMDDFLVLFVYMGYGVLFQPFDASEVLRGFDGSLREVIE